MSICYNELVFIAQFTSVFWWECTVARNG